MTNYSKAADRRVTSAMYRKQNGALETDSEIGASTRRRPRSFECWVFGVVFADLALVCGHSGGDLA
jgi:hypothetical protein